MSKQERFLHVIDSISEWSGKIVSFLLIPLVLIVVFEIVSRYVFHQPTIWVHELSTWLWGSVGLMAGAYTLRYQRHVAVDILQSRFTPRVRGVTELLATLCILLLCTILVWRGGIEAGYSIKIWEHSSTAWKPLLFPIKIMIPTAAFLLALQAIAKSVRDIRTIISGRLAL